MSNMYGMDQNYFAPRFVNKYQKVIYYICIHLDYRSVLIIQHLYKNEVEKHSYRIRKMSFKNFDFYIMLTVLRDRFIKRPFWVFPLRGPLKHV
jgi:hypothetical protein